MEGDGVQYHQKPCLRLDEKLREGGHMWTVYYTVKPEKDPNPKGCLDQ